MRVADNQGIMCSEQSRRMGISTYLQAVHTGRSWGPLHSWAGRHSALQHILGTCQNIRAKFSFSWRLVKALLGSTVFSRRLAFALEQPHRDAVSA